MRYIQLALLMIAVYLPAYEWALPTLAGINLFFSMFFYWLCFGLLAGIKASEVNPDIDVTDAWTTKVIQIGATIVLFVSGDMTYIVIAAFSLPWIITNFFTDVFATLLKWEILEVTDRPDNEE